jgi:hypothetical protein
MYSEQCPDPNSNFGTSLEQISSGRTVPLINVPGACSFLVSFASHYSLVSEEHLSIKSTYLVNRGKPQHIPARFTWSMFFSGLGGT